jgi:hypothetical protein
VRGVMGYEMVLVSGGGMSRAKRGGQSLLS